MIKNYFSQTAFTVCIFLIGSWLKVNAQVPVITSFTPLSAKPGDMVTITGSNFNNTASFNTVFFGATKATVTAATTTNLTVTVPIGTSFGPITLLNTGTGLICKSVYNFTPTFTPPRSIVAPADYAQKQDLATNNAPSSLVTTDFDGDGKPDLAVTNNGDSTVSVFRNTSTNSVISFAPKIDFTTLANPNGITAGDVDADGKPDLLITNVQDSTVSILKNISTNGVINFDTKVDIAVGLYPYHIAIGEIDGDGKPDITVSNIHIDAFAAVLNTSSTGTISFSAPVSFATGDDPTTVLLNDMDGDGKLDAVVSNSSSNSNSLSVFRNISTPGAATFDTNIDCLTGINPTSVAAADFDADGLIDLVSTNSGTNFVSIFKNTSTVGNISFNTKLDYTTDGGPYAVTVGDITGDGKPDIVTANANSQSVSVLQNTSTSGSINFNAKVDFSTGSSPVAVVIGDLDNDDIPEIVTANIGANTVSVLSKLISLPVRWFSMNGNVNTQKNALLHWSVYEYDVAKYEIEKSNNGIAFKKIGTLISVGNGTNNYDFTDINTLSGTAFYRIKQVDTDNRFSYSAIVKLTAESLVLTTVYPNPFNSYIVFTSSKKQTFSLTDVLGRIVKSINIHNGVNYVNTEDLHPGIYFIKMDDGKGMKVVKE